jgi:hypothetical protein
MKKLLKSFYEKVLSKTAEIIQLAWESHNHVKLLQILKGMRRANVTYSDGQNLDKCLKEVQAYAEASHTHTHKKKSQDQSDRWNHPFYKRDAQL